MSPFECRISMMALSLTAQLITVSILTLQRQIQHNNNVNKTSIDSIYDYIVVGSGSAGAVVANRLASKANIKVLLLEAGGPQNVVSDMPGLTPALIGTDIDWQFRTLPQANIGQSFHGQRINQPKGKCIGGTSTLYWMLYNRGNRLSYDNWARTYGATDWDYKSVLPYFIRSENNTSPKTLKESPGYHGTSGPMAVSQFPHADEILYLFQKQMNSFGIPTTDINGANQLGTMIYEVNVKDGVRSGTGNAYLDPNPYPSRLHILANALVTRVLINSSLTATGVEYMRNNIRYTVNATKEVIVSAGSPQLLMLSGIGPRDHLSSMGIPVIADLPVGNNFQDHVFIHHYYEVKNTSLLDSPVGPTVQQLYDFYVGHTGRLSQLPNSVTYFSTATNDDSRHPNTVIDVNTYNIVRNLSQATANYGSNVAQWQDYFRPHLGKQFLLVTSAIYRTYSRGTVRLASADPTDSPLIDPQYLSDKRDLQALVDITKILFYVTQTGQFAKYAQIFDGPMPGCELCAGKPMYQCDSYIRCIIRQVADSALHPGGPCRMGNINRTDVVVDPRLKVKGIKSLRVIDSSIIPELANANTNAASVMIGERGAQFLIDEMNKM